MSTDAPLTIILSRRDLRTLAAAVAFSALCLAAGLFLRAPVLAHSQDFGIGVNETGHPWWSWTGEVFPGGVPLYTVPAGYELILTGTAGWSVLWLEIDGVQAFPLTAAKTLLSGNGHLTVGPGSEITVQTTTSRLLYLQGYLVQL